MPKVTHSQDANPDLATSLLPTSRPYCSTRLWVEVDFTIVKVSPHPVAITGSKHRPLHSATLPVTGSKGSRAPYPGAGHVGRSRTGLLQPRYEPGAKPHRQLGLQEQIPPPWASPHLEAGSPRSRGHRMGFSRGLSPWLQTAAFPERLHRALPLCASVS